MISFESVDNNAFIDRASRKRIRSYVAKGKNVGRKPVRPSRIKAFGRNTASATAPNHIPRIENGDEDAVAHNLNIGQYVVLQIERHFHINKTGEPIREYKTQQE
jgi:hypothetical protein